VPASRFAVHRGAVLRAARTERRGKDDHDRVLEATAGATAERRGAGRRPRRGGSRLRERSGSSSIGAASTPTSPRARRAAHACYYPRPRDPDETLERSGLPTMPTCRLYRPLSGASGGGLDLALALGATRSCCSGRADTGFYLWWGRGGGAARRLGHHPRPRPRWQTIVLTTPSWTRSEALADRVAVIRDGSLVA